MKIAIVHDWLNQYGGAERVLEVLHQIFPAAPVYTSIYWPEAMPPAYRHWDIRTSFLNRFSPVRRHHQPFLPLYPLAFEQFDFSGYDLVLSNKSGFCHGIITPASTRHLCYCLTPTRYLWATRDYLDRERMGYLARLALPLILNYLRLWDQAAANRVDAFAAISRAVQERIQKFYRRPSQIIYPPVATQGFPSVADREDFYLVVSRLVPYKRIDLVVDAFNHLNLPLIIIGDGRDRPSLQARARNNIRFLGRLPDDQVHDYMARCKAFIFPGEEDFGITPVEANAAGAPVIAYAAGGALDTVIDGVTGTFFHQPTSESLAQVVARFRPADLDRAAIRVNAFRFDVSNFKQTLLGFINAQM
ncbi:MAG: glycosyltransferase [Chloroflexi bacterium]|nr:glycosyltransferase [Chloroflexota bacterium]